MYPVKSNTMKINAKRSNFHATAQYDVLLQRNLTTPTRPFEYEEARLVWTPIGQSVLTFS